MAFGDFIKLKQITDMVELYHFTNGQDDFYMTSSDRDVVIDTQTYVPYSIKRGEIKAYSDKLQNDLTIEMSKDNPIANIFKGFPPQRDVTVKIYRFVTTDVDQELSQLWGGIIQGAEFEGNRANLKCKGLESLFKRNILRRTYQSLCNHDVYDEGCKLIKADFSFQTVVNTVSADGVTITVASVDGNPDTTYDNGMFERLNGERMTILTQVGTTITLLNPFEDLSVGETITLVIGCDRTSAQCKARFSNFENFLGFENVPTRNPFGNSGLL